VIPTRQEYKEELALKTVIVWSTSDRAFFKVNLPVAEIRAAEEEMGAKLVEDPYLARILQTAFIDCLERNKRPPSVIRFNHMPLKDYFYRRLAIWAPGGKQTTNCNLYFERPQAVIAA
jgi:hypothetical protein